jgi:S-methylmethionine-dependent homocysteine/selenocysteine methylase
MLSWVTDGGLETDLIFHKGLDLPEFAAFHLVEEQPDLLLDYFRDYAAIAGKAGAGLELGTPTWRANPDWGTKLGYDATGLARANTASVELLRTLGKEVDRGRIAGVIGPRGDGYIAGDATADSAADYHHTQIRTFADVGVDLIHAMTINTPSEAIGIARAARAAGVPVCISFTVETDGTLPDGTPLRSAIERVDAAAAPDSYGLNCAHPTHVVPALDGGDWQQRITSFRPNASTMTHAELDAMEVLDEGDRDLLKRSNDDLLAQLPSVATLGGCCGTDATHVASLWGV